MAWYQNGQVISRDQPSDLAWVEARGPGDVLIRSRLSQRNLSQRPEYGRLSGRQIEPALEVVRKWQRCRRSAKVLIEPRGGDAATTLGKVQLRHCCPQP